MSLAGTKCKVFYLFIFNVHRKTPQIQSKHPQIPLCSQALDLSCISVSTVPLINKISKYLPKYKVLFTPWCEFILLPRNKTRQIRCLLLHLTFLFPFPLRPGAAPVYFRDAGCVSHETEGNCWWNDIPNLKIAEPRNPSWILQPEPCSLGARPGQRLPRWHPGFIYMSWLLLLLSGHQNSSCL